MNKHVVLSVIIAYAKPDRKSLLKTIITLTEAKYDDKKG